MLREPLGKVRSNRGRPWTLAQKPIFNKPCCIPTGCLVLVLFSFHFNSSKNKIKKVALFEIL